MKTWSVDNTMGAADRESRLHILGLVLSTLAVVLVGCLGQQGECVCVCVCVCERERERERSGQSRAY